MNELNIGWDSESQTSCKTTLRNYVYGLGENQAKSLLRKTNEWIKTVPEPAKVRHVIDTGLYCVARLQKDNS